MSWQVAFEFVLLISQNKYLSQLPLNYRTKLVMIFRTQTVNYRILTTLERCQHIHPCHNGILILFFILHSTKSKIVLFRSIWSIGKNLMQLRNCTFSVTEIIHNISSKINIEHCWMLPWFEWWWTWDVWPTLCPSHPSITASFRHAQLRSSMVTAKQKNNSILLLQMQNVRTMRCNT